MSTGQLPDDLYPIGTYVCHDGHGLGRIIGYNGQPKEDLDKQLKLIAEGALNDLTPADQAMLCGGLIGGFYSADKYPYVVKFEPNPEMGKKYPSAAKQFEDGYQDVYSVHGLWFSKDKENWVKWGWDGELVTGVDIHKQLLKEGKKS